MSKKVILYLFAGVLSISTLSGCKVFKKKCDCPKFSEQNTSETEEVADVIQPSN